MTRPTPWLSVVIPARDSEATVGAAIRSVLDQSEAADIEILVVDDGSSDATRERAEALGDPRIRILGGPGRGAAAARNVGLRGAHGAWVALLDADDRWLPGHVDALQGVLEADEVSVACFGAARHIDEQRRLIRLFTVKPEDATLEGLLSRRLQPTTSATAVRRDVALSVGGFDEGFRRPAGVEDIDLWWRLAARGHCTVQPTPLCEYVVHLSRDRFRSREDLIDLRADRQRCIARLRGAVPPRLLRVAAAQHHAILARYWLLADYRAEAREDARRALRYSVTLDGAAALALTLLPLPLSRGVRRFGRLASRLADRP
jgi:glycosyltransferase involved in cell wall biosynthesis